MKYTVILPTIGTYLLSNCLGSMSENVRKNTIVFGNGRNIKVDRDVLEFVDNNENVGLARAWNYGRQYVLDNDQDYLIICSQTVQFNEGMDDFIKFLEKIKPKYAGSSVVSWHLIALSKELLQTVGKFDNNFYPIYYEDTDYIVRMKKYGVYDGPGWQQTRVATRTVEDAKSLQLGLRLNLEGCRQYMIKKWGTDSYLDEPYEHPFNNPDFPLDYFEDKTPEQLRNEYGYETDGNSYRLYI